MNRKNFLQEMKVQSEAFARCNGDILEMIAEHAEDFRDIINDFEEMHNRVPSANDLLWIASQHCGQDITK
jgi:alpha-glucuronidase